jgi:hypothetical protein
MVNNHCKKRLKYFGIFYERGIIGRRNEHTDVKAPPTPEDYAGNTHVNISLSDL